jgi:hypothetical protein
VYIAGCFSRAICLADAGYKLLRHVMTPFKIEIGMPKDEANYNFNHSRTRICIERAIGLLKMKFKRFSAPLAGDPDSSQRLIVAALILHNAFIDFGESVPLVIERDPEQDEDEEAVDLTDGDVAERRRNALKSFLMN